MIARIALTEKPEFSIPRLVNTVRLRMPDKLRVSPPRELDGKPSFRIGDTVVQMASSSKSIRWKDRAEVIRNSESWLNNEAALDHLCNLSFRISNTKSPWTRANYLTVVLAAALEQCPDVAGVYWEAARQFFPAATFRDLASDPHVIANIWVVSCIRATGNNRAEGYTRGLKLFVGRELEICNAELSCEELRERFQSLIGYLAEKGRTVKHGDSLGHFGDVRIKAIFDDRSALGIAGPVIKLNYSTSNSPIADVTPIKPKPVASASAMPPKSIKHRTTRLNKTLAKSPNTTDGSVPKTVGQQVEVSKTTAAAPQPTVPKQVAPKQADRMKTEPGNTRQQQSTRKQFIPKHTEPKQTEPQTTKTAVLESTRSTPVSEEGGGRLQAVRDLERNGWPQWTHQRRHRLPLAAGIVLAAGILGVAGWFLFSQWGDSLFGEGTSTVQNRENNSGGSVMESSAGSGNDSSQVPRFVGALPDHTGPDQSGGVIKPGNNRSAIQSMVYSSDSKYLIAATTGSNLQIYNADSMELLQDYPVHEESNSELHLAMAGFVNRLFVGGASGRVHSFELDDSGILISKGHFEGHHSPITSLAAGPFGKRVCSGERNRKAILWDADDFESLNQFSLQGPALAVRFSTDGDKVLVVDRKRLSMFHIRKSWLDKESINSVFTRARIFGVQQIRSVQETVQQASISPDLDFISVQTNLGIRLLHYADKLWKFDGELNSHETSSCILFLGDGKHLLSGTKDVVVWDYARSESVRRWEMDSVRSVAEIAVSPDGSKVSAVSSQSGEIKILRNGPPTVRKKPPAILAQFPRTGNSASGSADTIPEELDAEFFQIATELDRQKHDWESVRSVRDGQFFVVQSLNNDLFVFDGKTGKQTCETRSPVRSEQSALDLPQNVGAFVTAGNDGYDVWQIDDSGQATSPGKLAGIGNDIRLVTFDPQVRMFWAMDKDSDTIRLCSVDHRFESIEVSDVAGHPDFVFSEDGKWAFAASDTRRVSIRLEDRSVDISNNPGNYPWPLYAVAFSTDASLSAEVRTIKDEMVMQVYEPANGFAMIHEHRIDFENKPNDIIQKIGFSPDHERLYVASQHRLKVFDIKTGEAVIVYDMADSSIHPFAWRDDGILVACYADNSFVSPRVIRLKVDEAVRSLQ